jgi:2'-5' RNA ligase
MREKFTALSIPIEEAFFLQQFRERHIFTPAAKKPPHVTIYSPFKEMEVVNELLVKELTEFFSSFNQFSLTLNGTGRFAQIGVLYLIVEPTKPFRELNRAIQEKYPELEPFISDPILHVTLARVKDVDGVEKEFYQEYGSRLPIQATAKEICLYEKCDKVWHKRNSFPLPSR